MRSSDESTLRPVRPEVVSSASTFHGSSAWRNSQLHAISSDRTDLRKTEFFMSGEPALGEGKTVAVNKTQHFGKVALDEVRQHEAVVQCCIPANELSVVRLAPEKWPPARGSAASRPDPCGSAEPFQTRATQAVPGAARDLPGDTVCRCRIQRGGSCRSRRPAGCGRGHPECRADTPCLLREAD